MGKFIDETGNRHSRLVVIKQSDHDKHGKITWFCQCDCGNQVIIRGADLRSGNTKSCGCLKPTAWIPWNENFFDALNSDVAYIIGFIIADGHITKRDPVIGVNQKGSAPLLRIAKLVNYKGNLRPRTNDNYGLYLRSQHAVEILTSIYKIPRGHAKSYEVRIPSTIPKEFLPHLIRGYFDGDGSISMIGRYVGFDSGSPCLLDDVNNILINYANMSLGWCVENKYIKKNGQEGQKYTLRWTRQLDILKFAQYIYGPDHDVYGSDLYLRRKKKCFDQLFVPWREYNWLYQEFVEKGRSKQSIAKEFGLHTLFISHWIKDYDLEAERTKHWSLNLGI